MFPQMNPYLLRLNLEHIHCDICCLQLEDRLENQLPADALNDSTAADKVDQSQLLSLREKIEELERQCEKITEEKEILEARIEQRNMQV